MMKRQTKDVYVDVLSTDDGLEFMVRFHDNCQKKYKFSRYEVAAFRSSDRDFIEAIVCEYYEGLNQSTAGLRLHFS